MNQSNRLLVIVLLLGSGAPLAAQSQDSTLERSMVQLTTAIAPNRNESCRGLLISEKGLILTPWRNVCVTGGVTCTIGGPMTNPRVIGVHPTRDLALIQVDLSKVNPQYGPKSAKLAKASVNVGDQIFLFQVYQPVPGIVCSETQPVGNPECFWIKGKDPKAMAPWPDGWGGSQPRPDCWVTNLQGEVQGVVARVIVNGKMCLRVIPVHDVKPEEFVPPAQRRPNTQKAEELVRMADALESSNQKNPWRPHPIGAFEPEPMEYLRMALAEDPTNRDVNFRLGVIRSDSKATTSTGSRDLPDPTVGKTSDQVDTEFIRSRMNTALEHLKEGRTKLGLDILKDIVATFPKNPEARPARELLQKLDPPK